MPKPIDPKYPSPHYRFLVLFRWCYHLQEMKTSLDLLMHQGVLPDFWRLSQIQKQFANPKLSKHYKRNRVEEKFPCELKTNTLTHQRFH
jgi:hypothetical protein